MRKVILASFLILLSSSSIFCQVAPVKSEFLKATFCGKQSENKHEIQISKEELETCDWMITMVDTNYKVSEFKMTFVDKSKLLTERTFMGNIIPEEYRQKIIYDAKIVFLEYIKAVKGKGERLSVMPIGIRVM